MCNTCHSKCTHGNPKNNCKDCGTLTISKDICVKCKLKPVQIKKSGMCKCCHKKDCPHGKRKHRCKDCKGASICEHDRIRRDCVDCEGSGICQHGIRRSRCADCGVGFCEHEKLKENCKVCSSQFCIHEKQKRFCEQCGGNGLCEHGKIKYYCRKCDGGIFCEHDIQRHTCKDCSPLSHLAKIVRGRTWAILKHQKEQKSIEYLCCSYEDLRSHIESQFKKGMTWENYGEWEIDHVVPLKFENPTLEQLVERLHYTNLQPLWANENREKSNKWIG